MDPNAHATPPVRAASPEAEAPGTEDQAPERFFRAFVRALVDDATFDVRKNPTLWLGFLMALPIPVVAWAAHSPAWLLLLSIPAPLFWGVVL
ncbi:MAG: hypothetical protein ACC662_11660, partial [Planctomycetota bacterium]